VIEQLASHLALSAQVNLAVRRGPTRAIEGVAVLEAPDLSEAELPDATVLIGGLAQPDPERVLELPAKKGTPLFFFQGYGTPDNPRVSAMLRRQPAVLAVSSFLAERAASYGCQVELFQPGLDRSVLHPGPPCAERGAVVAMLTHGTDWKATQDGLGALAHLCAALPSVDVRLFGGGAPPTTERAAGMRVRHLGELSREQVAELLREAAVLVCPSWEEGLGLPGIEALACGTALATTDTKGSRDYAFDGESALVTPPRRPDLLAESVIRLLREPQLRGRLAERGRAHVLATYPPWPEAAARFRGAVARLLNQTRPMAPSAR
jgi:glycosyltransferase involved in cell wall biosynthesis